MKKYRWGIYALLYSWLGATYACMPYQGVPFTVYEIEDKITTPGFEAVCSLYTKDFQWFGSGVLVDNKEILTAAHCVEELAYVSFDKGRHYYEVSSATIHPSYDDWFYGGGDIGVAILVTAPPVKPIFLHEFEPEIGDAILQVGYGPDEVKRISRPNIFISYKEENALYWEPTPSHACPGDSGGAVLVFDQKDCRYELVAITVTVHWDRETGIVRLSGATLVEPYRDWINERIEWTLSDPIGLPELPVVGLD